MSDPLHTDVESLPGYQFSDLALKLATASKLASIMQSIYNENPEFWPYGLSPGHFNEYNPIVDQSSMKIAGFVGWQVLENEGKKLGYYSVGLLPEFRGKGLATKAVKSLTDGKRASVDEVRALIHQDNERSIKLADRLGIPKDIGDPDSKSASAWSKLVSALFGAAKSKAVTHNIIPASVGLGLSELENRTVLNSANDDVKNLNRILGAGSGWLFKRQPVPAVGGWLLKQQGAKALDTYMKDAPLRKQIADVNLQAAQAAERSTAADLQSSQLQHDMLLKEMESKGEWSNQDKLLAGLLGLGVLSGGVYAYNALKPKTRPTKSKGKQVVKGDPSQRRAGTVTIKLPYSALPEEFGKSIVDADDFPKALTTVS